MNVDVTNLEITGHGERAVPNQFLRQSGETTTLAVLLPGLGYTADMPLFYYAEWIALQRGWDVLQVDYAYPRLTPDSSPEQIEAFRARVRGDVDAALDAGLQQRPYERVVLIGKSLGTRAMVHLLAREIEQEVWNVWLTPLINEPDVRERIERYPDRTFVAIGTEDFAYDGGYLERLKETGAVETVIIAGADHSLDIPGDLPGSVAVMGRLMSRLDAFLPRDATEESANP